MQRELQTGTKAGQVAEELLGSGTLGGGGGLTAEAASPHTYFLVLQGLLYQHRKHQGKEVDLLFVSYSKVDIIMHLAHSNPLGGHLVEQNTLEKIKDHFLWPDMNIEVKNFCQHCPHC